MVDSQQSINKGLQMERVTADDIVKMGLGAMLVAKEKGDSDTK